MPHALRVTGAWTGLLRNWIDAQEFTDASAREAAVISAQLARLRPGDAVPVAAWRELLRRALLLVPDRTAAELEIGSCVRPAHVGVLGYLVLACRTLGDAMLAYQRYEQLFYGVDIVQLEGGREDIELRWPQQLSELGQAGDGVAIAALHTFMKRQMQDPPSLTRITFVEQVSPPAAAEYERFFGCPVIFGSTAVSLRFPRSYLAALMPDSDPDLLALLDGQAQALLHNAPAGTGAALQQSALQQVLLRLLGDGDVSLLRAAGLMHVSPRTLQRQLAASGLSWQQWLDRSRQQLAEHYLRDPALSLSDVSLLLGFSEQSAFTRAFRRWTGTTPGQFRRP